MPDMATYDLDTDPYDGDDWLDDVEHPLGTRWGSIGPGNAGEECCPCGYYLGWPETTTDEDRAAMRRLWDEHAAACGSCPDRRTAAVKTPSAGTSMATGGACPAVEDAEVGALGEEVEPRSPAVPSRPAAPTAFDGEDRVGRGWRVVPGSSPDPDVTILAIASGGLILDTQQVLQLIAALSQTAARGERDV